MVDPHGEYDDGYEIIPFTYKGTIAHTTNQLVQAIQIQAMYDKITDLIDGLIEQIELSRRRRISIRVNIANAKADGIIISQFLEQLTQKEGKWNPPLLVVVEEAAAYDCLPLVRRGRHYGIQAILVSQDPLSGETRTNTRTITGANDPAITEKIDPSIAFAAQQLDQGEFLYQSEKGRWCRYRYTARKADAA